MAPLKNCLLSLAWPHITCCVLLQVLIETRIRLISGLKRYFHDKRAEGLLSAGGIQLLDRACDASMDHDKDPLHMLEMMYT